MNNLKYILSTIFLKSSLLAILGCAVNTGNPVGKTQPKSPGTPTSAPSEKGTTLILDIGALAGGQIKIPVKELELVPQGSSLNSPKKIKINYEISTVLRSGQKASLFSKFAVTPGIYDRLILKIDPSSTATYTANPTNDQKSSEKKIAVPPYKYYVKESNADTDAQFEVVQIVFELGDDLLRVGDVEDQTLTVSRDVTGNIKNFSSLPPIITDYFKTKNDINYEYSFDPNISKTPPQTSNLPQETKPSGSPDTVSTAQSTGSSTSTTTTPITPAKQPELPTAPPTVGSSSADGGSVTINLQFAQPGAITKRIVFCLYDTSTNESLILNDVGCDLASAVAPATMASASRYTGYFVLNSNKSYLLYSRDAGTQSVLDVQSFSGNGQLIFTKNFP